MRTPPLIIRHLTSPLFVLALALGPTAGSPASPGDAVDGIELLPVRPLPGEAFPGGFFRPEPGERPAARAAAGVPRPAGSAPYALVRATPSDRALGERLLEHPAHGDGGGADIQEFAAAQIRHLDSACEPAGECEEPCNVVLLTWTETTSNPDGVDVFVDSEFAGSVDGLPEDALPGTNAVLLSDVEAGPHVFRVEELAAGGFGEVEQVVLDAQPSADVENLRCEPGQEGSGDGTCAAGVLWQNPGLPPDQYLVNVDDGAAGGAFGVSLPGLVLGGVSDGEHCVEMTGLVENGEGTYLGCPVESCCTIDCTPEPCRAPSTLFLCQMAFSASDGQSRVLLLYISGDTSYENVGIVANGQALGTVEPLTGDPAFQAVMVTGLGSGPWEIGARGDCGPDGVSTPATVDFEVRERSPHTSAVAGDIACELDPQTGITTVAWERDEPSEFIFVWEGVEPLPADGARFPDRILSGRTTQIAVEGLREGASVWLEFFSYRDGACYGSGVIECPIVETEPPPPAVFIRGLCSGMGSQPNIQSAIFGLNWLFISGPQPPCKEACDVNADGAVNLTDMVHLLVFLFRSGQPPANWTDTDMDGVADAVCEPLPEGADCEIPHAACQEDG